MKYHFDQSMIWHVVFHPGPCLWGKYRHVSLAGYSNETWVHLDLSIYGAHIAAIYAHDEVNDYLTFLLAHYTVLRFGSANGAKSHFLRPMTCVSFVKHVLGLRSGALRPDGLLRFLISNCDVEILNEAEHPSRNT